jgi:hypothetical protein
VGFKSIPYYLATHEYKRGLTMKYRLYTYDVWGNARDGYEVNDIHIATRYADSSHNIMAIEQIIIDIDPETATDYQINRLLKCRGITWESDYRYEMYLYGTVKRNGKPIAELRPYNEEK